MTALCAERFWRTMMSGADAGYRRAQAVLTTTQHIEAYGGTQLSREFLESFAQSVASGAVPLHFNHDGRRPLEVRNIEAGVRGRPDGEWEVWAAFDVPTQQWADWQAELAELGAPGGMSFTVLVSRMALRRAAGRPLVARVHADAAHYSSQQIARAAEDLAAEVSDVTAGHLFQFGFVPDPTVVIELAGQVLSAIPADTLSLLLQEATGRFLTREAKEAPPDAVPKFQIDVEETAESRKLSAHVSTSDPVELRKAMSELMRSLHESGTLDWADGRWNRVDPPVPGAPR